MKELEILKNKISPKTLAKIINIKDCSYSFLSRMRIKLENKFEISIINGVGAYADEGSYEIAIFKPDKEFYLEESVKGYQTGEDVIKWIEEIANL